MTRRSTGIYPDDWPEIARRVKDEAGWRCIRCGHAHDPAAGYTLTVHHLDLDPANCRWWNLLPLCQRCHLSVQSRVYLNRPWLMVPHSEWFKPYAGGWFAFRYLGLELEREVIEQDIDRYADIERRVYSGEAA